MPGNCLTLAVLIGCEIELLGTLEGGLQFRNGLGLSRRDCVEGLKVIVNVDGELAQRTLFLFRGQLFGFG